MGKDESWKVSERFSFLCKNQLDLRACKPWVTIAVTSFICLFSFIHDKLNTFYMSDINTGVGLGIIGLML